VCAAAGVDWVLLDLEHGAGGEEQVGPVIIAAAANGVRCWCQMAQQQPRSTSRDGRS
jgi:2-keto-3-deoxy-L-rhamnonate aldolase RhmA